ncbi:MAG: glutathione peroxidase [Phocaeicola sp.]
MKTIYDFKAIDNKGNEIDFKQFEGKVLLIVNTASKCGFTPQYKALETLYSRYKDQGLVVLGFPCDQFAHQEPGGDEAIASFCERNFGVTFPLMKKVDVNGDQALPLFNYLKSETKGLFGSRIKWNFTKFLVSADGKSIKRHSPLKNPMAFEEQIVNLLPKREK